MARSDISCTGCKIPQNCACHRARPPRVDAHDSFWLGCDSKEVCWGVRLSACSLPLHSKTGVCVGRLHWK